MSTRRPVRSIARAGCFMRWTGRGRRYGRGGSSSSPKATRTPAGFTNTVALCGVAFTAGHLRLLAGYTQRIVLLLDADGAGEASMEKIVAMLSCGTDPEGERLEPACLFEVSRMQLPYGEDPDSLLHGSGFVSFRRQITASLHLALLETYEHHLLRQIAKTVSDLSLCLSCEDRISLLSLLAKQKSRLSRVTMRLGRNVVV